MTGTANGLLLPPAGAEAIVADLVRYGRERAETGGFMLAPIGTDTVTTIAYAGTTGIVRRSDLFEVSELALDALFAHVENQDLWIPAQYHSHRFAAFMSECDIEHGLSVPGFMSAIVPFYGDPQPDPRAWGWWRFEGGWLPLDPPGPAAGEVAVLVFDEEGVRGT